VIAELTLTAVATGVASLALTAAVRRYALARALLDVPNVRSSHTTPTPRGGGLAIVCAILPALGWAWTRGWVPGDFFMAVAGGGLLTAGIGWVDDHRHVPAGVRLVVHFYSAAWAVFWLGGLSDLRAGPLMIPLGATGSPLAAVFIVWMLNLYNFMDGIDGIATVEAVMVCVGSALVAWLVGAPHVAGVAILIAAACTGFLVWNWAPARIFLGDVGSSFVGFVLGVTALFSERSAGPPLLFWTILLGVFLMDATLTLLRRLLRGDAVLSAHRSHAYQRAVQSGYSHAAVTTAVAMTNLLLLGLVLLAVAEPRLLLASLVATVALLGWLYHWVERRQPM
jgi:Fuc2NAc and GlcNAc transferase